MVCLLCIFILNSVLSVFCPFFLCLPSLPMNTVGHTVSSLPTNDNPNYAHMSHLCPIVILPIPGIFKPTSARLSVYFV